MNVLQETHLLIVEDEKPKRFVFKNTFYCSHRNSRKRGEAILIPNTIHFACRKEIKHNEGRYFTVKGLMDQTLLHW